ncbi:unnamed protein product [Vitrella brassicaformis CCMP3155]|uniref:Uncharacterized protein n=1 Tax=Vitrella brassicaformis (strain CCMP3155) TaxID=1169540 RepID=A0A0G4H4Q1_VITBC|nr:unnamed protein product [Vitrella brassicaformis CCMP3155]|eukprot:CEM38768.1 unnamed protein product [Vitrella brassicaformis CCMP3155]
MWHLTRSRSSQQPSRAAAAALRHLTWCHMAQPLLGGYRETWKVEELQAATCETRIPRSSREARVRVIMRLGVVVGLMALLIAPSGAVSGMAALLSVAHDRQWFMVYVGLATVVVPAVAMVLLCSEVAYPPRCHREAGVRGIILLCVLVGLLLIVAGSLAMLIGHLVFYHDKYTRAYADVPALVLLCLGGLAFVALAVAMVLLCVELVCAGWLKRAVKAGGFLGRLIQLSYMHTSKTP